jgi:hypothetical protein
MTRFDIERKSIAMKINVIIICIVFISQSANRNVIASPLFHYFSSRYQTTTSQNSDKSKKRKQKSRTSLNQRMQSSAKAIQAGRDVNTVSSKSVIPVGYFATHIACLKGASIIISTYDFPEKEIASVKSHSHLIEFIRSRNNLPCETDSIIMIRTLDGSVLKTNNQIDLLANNNSGVIIIPKKVLDSYGSSGLAFNHISKLINNGRLESNANKSGRISPSSLSQQMTNSPGGIQAGGNVTISQEMPQRTLSTEQRDKLIKFLNPLPKGKITITSVLGDGESYKFANELNTILKASGWQTDGVNQAVFNGAPVGLIVQIKNRVNIPPHAMSLINALNYIGIQPTGEVNLQNPDQSVSLIVGHRR